MYLSKFLVTLKRKLHKKSGFTFTELLAATIIMLLSTGLVVQCVDIAKEQYADRTMDSEAQLLVNSLSDAIQDYLQYASEIEPVASTTPQAVTSFHSDRVGKSGDFYVRVDDDNDVIVANGGDWNGIRGQIVFIDRDGVSHDLISSTAYKSDSSPKGSMVAAMMMTYYKTDGVAEFHPTVWIYAEGSDRVLAKKSFVVGKAYDVYEDLKTYTVTFDFDNGSEIISQKVIEGDKAIEPSNQTKEGFEFGGWYETKDFDTNGLKDGVTPFSFDTEIHGDIALKANWTEESNTYTVTFQPRNGNDPDKIETDSYGKLTKNPTDPTLSNYTFQGWYNTLDGAKNLNNNNKVNLEGFTTHEDVTLYAGWKKHTVIQKGDSFNVCLSLGDKTKKKYDMIWNADGTLTVKATYTTKGERYDQKTFTIKAKTLPGNTSYKAATTTGNVGSIKWEWDGSIGTFVGTCEYNKKTYTYYLGYDISYNDSDINVYTYWDTSKMYPITVSIDDKQFE